LQSWQKAPHLPSDISALETIRLNLARLTGILHDESRSPAPHLCLQFASASKIYAAVSRIAGTARNESIVREGIAVFAALVDSEEEDFLENGGFAEALMVMIVRISGGAGGVVLGEDTEIEVLELLFNIAAKIRLQPEILPVWFTTKETRRPDLQQTDGPEGAREKKEKDVDFVGLTQKEDFPLCYQLIDHVHHEGKIGDFARTGLLYIFESAYRSKELEKWIVESDLATLMASGLGALYSQLSRYTLPRCIPSVCFGRKLTSSRKLSILHNHSELPIILSLSDYGDMKPSPEADNFFSPDFQLHMSTFLSYLTFWQDILNHCHSVDVRQTLIDHFQVLFLQQLL
jgi:hypothetical protein